MTRTPRDQRQRDGTGWYRITGLRRAARRLAGIAASPASGPAAEQVQEFVPYVIKFDLDAAGLLAELQDGARP